MTTAIAPTPPRAIAIEDKRRRTEADPDFARLHAATVRRLDRCLRELVRNLRRKDMGDADAQSAFIHHATDVLRSAYEEAHREGQRDYWQQVSLKRNPPLSQPAETRTRQVLAWYAVASLTKMAREAASAAQAARHATKTASLSTGGDVDRPAPELAGDPPVSIAAGSGPYRARAARMAPTGHTVSYHRAEHITLAGSDASSGDPLTDWYDGTDQRVGLQASITWAGLQDGYADSGRMDPAAPFTLIYWNLGPVRTHHCDDCLALASNNPYNAPWVSGGNQLEQTPGDGRTMCGAGCLCDLSYAPDTSADEQRAAMKWQAFMGNAEAYASQIGTAAGYATPDYSGYGPYGPGILYNAPRFQPESGETTEDQNQPPTVPDVIPTPRSEVLSDDQKAALDRMRDAIEAWDTLRGDLPEAPEMFARIEDVAGESGLPTGGMLPEWDALTPEQQHTISEMVAALWDWYAATEGDVAGDLEQQFAEWDADNIKLYGHPPGYSQNRDAHGRWAPGDGGGHDYHIALGTDDTLHHASTLLGRNVSADEIAQLGGALPGTRVHIFADTKLVSVRVHGEIEADREIKRDAAGRLFIENRSIEVPSEEQGRGRATESLATQVRIAPSFGINYIETYGVRFEDDFGVRVVGYKVLPRLGYDAPIPSQLRGELPSSLASSQTLQDLYHASGGAEWWEEHGTSLAMHFDLTPGSRSRRILAHRIQLHDLDVQTIRLSGHPPGYDEQDHDPKTGQWLPGRGPLGGGIPSGGKKGSGRTGGLRKRAGTSEQAASNEKKIEEFYAKTEARAARERNTKSASEQVQYENRERVQTQWRTDFGRELSNEEVAGLAGAQRGAQVNVDRFGIITVEDRGRGYSSQCRLLKPGYDRPDDGGGVQNMAYYHLSPRGERGDPLPADDPRVVESLRGQVRASREQMAQHGQLEYLHMQCRPNVGDHVILAVLGFDASLGARTMAETRAKTMAAAPDFVQHAGTVRALMATDVGGLWWVRNGLTPSLDFVTRAGSASSKALDEYLRDHGKPGLEQP